MISKAHLTVDDIQKAIAFEEIMLSFFEGQINLGKYATTKNPKQAHQVTSDRLTALLGFAEHYDPLWKPTP